LQDNDLIRVDATRRETPDLPAQVAPPAEEESLLKVLLKPSAPKTSVGHTIIAEVEKSLPENPVTIEPQSQGGIPLSLDNGGPCGPGGPSKQFDWPKDFDLAGQPQFGVLPGEQDETVIPPRPSQTEPPAPQEAQDNSSQASNSANIAYMGHQKFRSPEDPPAEEVSTTESSLFEKCSHCDEHPVDMEAHMAAWHPEV